MTKKNTSVALPGGLAGLVHAAQRQPQADPSPSQAATTKPSRQSASTPERPLPTPPGTPSAATDDRWEEFLTLAREYHRASNLGAVYIDRDLKRQLGLLRASSIGVSTSALLSAIVAQFLREHAAEVERSVSE